MSPPPTEKWQATDTRAAVCVCVRVRGRVCSFQNTTLRPDVCKLPLKFSAGKKTWTEIFSQCWAKKSQSHKSACVCASVCGMDPLDGGPVPCHSETTSQSFRRSKISSPPPPPRMCCSRQHLSPSGWQQTTEEGTGELRRKLVTARERVSDFGAIITRCAAENEDSHVGGDPLS